MPQFHRIALRGPWQFEWVAHSRGPADAPAEATAASGRVKLPADWRTLFGTVSGTVRFRRRFHRPTNLEPHERVHLAFDGVSDSAEVFLGDVHVGSLGGGPTRRFDVTGLLQSANELVVEVTYHAAAGAAGPGGLWGLVALEIVGR